MTQEDEDELARRRVPRRNPRLFGHGAAQGEFMEAVAARRMHHAWLLTGPPGVGKATLAYRLARRLLTHAGDPDDWRAPVFRRLAMESHADVLTVERVWDEKTKRLPQEIPVHKVRQVAGFMHLTAAEGGWRVVVVDGAEYMNRSSSNALLKILEEPPQRAVLFLTSSAPGRLLPTIRSRCRRLRLDALGAGEMEAALAYLVPDVADGDRADLVAVADGSPGRAVALADEGGVALAGLAREVLQARAVEVPRMHAIADAVTKGDVGFGTFMGLLRAGVAEAVRGAARGGQGALMSRPLAQWGEVWHGLGRLQDETERFNLDKRTAVIAGLELLAIK